MMICEGLIFLINIDKANVIAYINKKTENENFDVKRCYYHQKKKYDLIKDVLAFANSSSAGEKYIVFNIDNDNFQLCEMDMSTLPDVSDINTLLREYCEPTINIELNRFNYNGGQVAYLKICKSNLDFPYMLKKDYMIDGKAKLHQGQIYIRRGATNFIANRADIDILIDMRVSKTLKIEVQSIDKKQIIVDKQIKSMYSSSFIFTNAAKTNVLVKRAYIKLETLKSVFSIDVSFISGLNTQSFNSQELLHIAPFDISSNTTIQKNIYFTISPECINILKQSEEMKATLIFVDVNNNEIISNTELWSIESN